MMISDRKQVIRKLDNLCQSRFDEGKGEEKGKRKLISSHQHAWGGWRSEGLQGGLWGGWPWGSCFQQKPKRRDLGSEQKSFCFSRNLRRKEVVSEV